MSKYEPSPKAPAVANMLEAMSQQMYGRGRIDSIKSGVCVACGTSVEAFRDALSAREYTISGLCQTCQDDVFKEED